MWNVEYTDEFEAWWETLDVSEQESVTASVELLERLGPQLSRPHADTLNGSRHSNMKELRTQHRNIRGDRFGHFSRLIPAKQQSC